MRVFISSCLLLLISLSFSVQGAEVEFDLSHDRVIRQAPENVNPEPAIPPLTPPAPGVKMTFAELKKEYNLADPVSEDYPVIFNMILFVSVSLILALIAICVAIGTMDPGRDSLIYRVTSAQKYKKDN